MHTVYIIVYAGLCWLPGNIQYKCYEMKSFNTPQAACKFTEAIVDHDWAAYKLREPGIELQAPGCAYTQPRLPVAKEIELVCVR